MSLFTRKKNLNTKIPFPTGPLIVVKRIRLNSFLSNIIIMASFFLFKYTLTKVFRDRSTFVTLSFCFSKDRPMSSQWESKKLKLLSKTTLTVAADEQWWKHLCTHTKSTKRWPERRRLFACSTERYGMRTWYCTSLPLSWENNAAFWFLELLTFPETKVPNRWLTRRAESQTPRTHLRFKYRDQSWVDRFTQKALRLWCRLASIELRGPYAL